MSRHRNVRSMNYTDEYDGYDDVYGHSVEDDSCISPSDAAQFIYDRARGTQGMSGYFSAQKDIQEEDEGECDEKTGKERRDSVNFKLPDLNELDLARLNSCMDEIRNVIGDSVSEKVLVETILQYDFDVAKSLDAVLDNSSNDTKTEGIEQRETLNKDRQPTILRTPKPGLSQLIKNQRLNAKDPSRNVCLGSKINFNQSQNFAISKCDRFDYESRDPEMDTNDSVTSVNNGPTFSSLSELTSFHLSKSKMNNSQGKFIIPKFTVPKNNLPKLSTFTNYQQSLEQIKRRKENQSPSNLPTTSQSVDSEDWFIDLSSALRAVSNGPVLKQDKTETAMPHESFVPQFVDCEVQEMFIDDNILHCEMNVSHVIHSDLSSSKLRSRFGKVLCTKYKRATDMPYITHGFNPLRQLQCFGFNTPSPDDAIMKHIRLNK